MRRIQSLIAGLGTSRLSETFVPRGVVSLLVLLAVVTPWLLYQSRMATFSLGWDDFRFVNDSLTWERTKGSLLKPFSNHLFPPFRLLTWALVIRAGRLSALPESLCLGSFVALTLALLVLYEFVSRESDSPVRGITAVLVGGITTAYFPAVAEYSASQIVWGVACTLLVLRCLQSARESFRWRATIGSCLAALVAPAWISTGLLAGPLGSLYAWLGGRDGRWSPRQRLLLVAAPLIGTLTFVLLALGLAGRGLLDPPESGAARPLDDFRLLQGAYLADRIGTEHLLFWNFGLPTPLATEQFLVCSVAVLAFITWWLGRAEFRSQAICGLALCLASYLFIYGFRHHLGLERLRIARWYLVFPQFGWALFLSAGLAPANPGRSRQVSVLDAARLATLGLALVLLHLPVAERQTQDMVDPHQQRQLNQLDQIQEVCSRWNIDRSTLEKAIGPFPISGSGGFDGLQLIECPAVGIPWNPNELHRRFEALLSTGSSDASGSESD